MLTASGTSYTQTDIVVEATGDTMLLLVPDSVSEGDTVRVFGYCHGRGATRTQVTTGNRVPIKDALIDAGFVVFGFDAGGNTWGSATAQAALVGAFGYIDQHYAVAHRVLGAESMGGNLAAVAAAKKQVAVDGFVFIFPSVSLAQAWERDPNGYRDEFVEFYGISPDGSNFDTITEPWDPFRFPASDFTGIHARIWSGTEDAIVSYGNVVVPFVDKLASVSDDVVLTTTASGHGDVENYDASAVLAFVNEVAPLEPVEQIVYRVEAMHLVGDDLKLYLLQPQV